jgi:excisionase family DNA binding protein
MEDQDQFVDIREAARHLGVSEMFLRRRVSDRWDGLKLKFYRIGGVKGRLRFRKSELTTFMQAYEGVSAGIEIKKEAVTE